MHWEKNTDYSAYVEEEIAKAQNTFGNCIFVLIFIIFHYFCLCACLEVSEDNLWGSENTYLKVKENKIKLCSMANCLMAVTDTSTIQLEV